jgi:riboflavin synthase
VFTGIIEEVGQVVELDVTDAGARLAVRAPLLAPLAHLGDSISISGACLTVVSVDDDILRFEAVPETLSRTSLGRLSHGSLVNLEDALRAGEPFGGHMVQGHVDGVGTVVSVTADGFARRVEIEPPADLLRYVVSKGSVAVDGVSLTVAGLGDASFTVSLIPETLERTNLGTAQAGSRVNLEVDVLAKYVERLVVAR